MIAKELADILEGQLRGNPEAEVRGFSIDSRRVEAGDTFFALR